jgi:hypothetical protein
MNSDMGKVCAAGQKSFVDYKQLAQWQLWTRRQDFAARTINDLFNGQIG